MDHHAEEDDLGFSALANGQMGSHEHPGEGAVPVDAELTPRQAAALSGELALTAPLVQRYPTLGDARADGWYQQGPFTPGLGLHMGGQIHLNMDGDMDPEDIATPTLIYDGITDDAPLAGFMYMSMTEDEPAGFTGPTDRWHYHTQVCTRFAADGSIEAPFGADADWVTEEMCAAEGGTLIQFSGYMVHVWTVPGYESDLGRFSDLNPAITCPDGTYHQIPQAEIGGADTTCLSA